MMGGLAAKASVYQRATRSSTRSMPSRRIRATTSITFARSSSVRPAAVDSNPTVAVCSGYRWRNAVDHAAEAVPDDMDPVVAESVPQPFEVVDQLVQGGRDRWHRAVSVPTEIETHTGEVGFEGGGRPSR